MKWRLRTALPATWFCPPAVSEQKETSLTALESEREKSLLEMCPQTLAERIARTDPREDRGEDHRRDSTAQPRGRSPQL